MARITGGTAQSEQFWKEQIAKEELAAMRFFIERIKQPPVQSGTSAILRKKLERMGVDNSMCSRVIEEAKKRSEERKLAEEQRKKAIVSTATPQYLAEQLDMRPPSPKTKALLYEGISHEGRGRSQYLRSRYKKNPEDKFPHQVPTSWDYGWRLGDSLRADKVKKSRFGRVSIVESTFFTRTGIAFGEQKPPKPWYAC
ncbi:hypothetical protein FBUS_06851 [Fasciolopsis buskii]|uniref:Sperm microtubule inner protein 1 C-terminal domain-containing protein n=1 Tax=Fasciolopsis buskii TaxID=27845 RepID=A0A8E0S2L2_9TREM|nr:hypothetical protein FBUS_06851 [Fasciolopsis buski]